MSTDDLRALQAPLKDRYRAEPGAALITLKAEGRIGERVTCSVQAGRALVEAGLHPATGGDGTFARSGDMLLEALAACAGVTMAAAGFQNIRLAFELDTDATAELLKTLRRLTGRYCVVYQTLREAPPVEVSLTSQAAGRAQPRAGGGCGFATGRKSGKRRLQLI